ncbi:MAG: class I SAM-dependent methyltransferase family protein [Promethearchaeota archaeon]|nr:MAG: class I SAM-dependent methyltransferase family protein [Candidatus Lokiarchaeota archaeon]
MKNKEISFIKVKKSEGQTFLKLLKAYFKDIAIINKKFKVEQESNYILFPLIDDHIELRNLINKISNKIPFEIVQKQGILNSQFKPNTLYDFLKNELPDKFLDMIPHSYDQLGKVAILEFKKFKDLKKKDTTIIKKKIANAIINLNKNIESVFEKKSKIRGQHRLRELEFLYGVNNTETLYKENGCIFKLDIVKTFFTPRLIYERKRISDANINENELIVDLFAGVGPFSIQIAKKNRVNIYSFDINPLAYKYLRENIKKNHLKGKIFPYNFDVKSLLDPQNELRKKLNDSADRIIMNLPENAIKFIDVACVLMKRSGGILHIYQFCEQPNAIEKALENLTKTLKNLNWKVKEVLNSKIVKSYSPKSDMIVIDAEIKMLE